MKPGTKIGISEDRYLFDPAAGTGGAYVLEKAQRWIYDGWNQTIELINDRPIRAYVWGVDMSGSREAAGGVGGLLNSADLLDDSNWDYLFDGNGNVIGLVDSGTGNGIGKYEYGPFGDVISANGETARLNRFRFSTKMEDLDAILLYYGYRYYAPYLGRWTARDPLGEPGGINLYAFVENNSANELDLLGERPATIQEFANRYKCYCLIDMLRGISKAVEKLKNAEGREWKNLGSMFDWLSSGGVEMVGIAGQGLTSSGRRLGSRCERQFIEDAEHWNDFNSRPSSKMHPPLTLGRGAGSTTTEYWIGAEIIRLENLIVETKEMARTLVKPQFCCPDEYTGKYQ